MFKYVGCSETVLVLEGSQYRSWNFNMYIIQMSLQVQ